MKDVTYTRKIPFSPPDISELEIQEVAEALRSGWITTGPRTKLLERRLAAYIAAGRTDVDTEADPARWSNRVVCLNSATAAEEMNLRILGVGPGDEVIVPAYTYTASASAVIHCGAKVVFVDIQRDGDPVSHMPEMDYAAMEAAITPRTKAIVSVDLGGLVCDYERIFAAVERKKALFTPLESDGTALGDLSSRIQKAIGRVAVVADCAHGLGGSRVVWGEKRYCGAIADMTSFSFHAVKKLTTGEGGAVTWRKHPDMDSEDVYRQLMLLSLHGQTKDALSKTQMGAWEYDIVGPYYKCNMTDIMASIGMAQLRRFPAMLKRRRRLIAFYDRELADQSVSVLQHFSDKERFASSGHLYMVKLMWQDEERRSEVIRKMASLGVATNVHYKPLPMLTAYSRMGFDIKDYPNAYEMFKNEITLPLYSRLTDEEAQYVVDCFKKVIS